MSIARVVLLVCATFVALPSFIYAGEFNDRLEQVFADLADSAPEEPDILDPDEAFIISAEILNADQLQFSWEIADGYYLYRDNFRFNIERSDITPRPAVISRGKIKEDPDFGRVEVLHHQASAILQLNKENTDEMILNMVVTYQGCKEDVICYPPVNKNLSFLIPAGLATNVANDNIRISEQDAITKKLTQNNILISVLIFFGFGLLAAFTACVYPMIPILSSIIVGQGKQVSTQRAFALSLAYVLPIAITYAVLGIISAQLGYNLQAASQNVWVLSTFSAIFVLLAFSMFGFYELRLPSNWQTKLSKLSSKQEHGSFYGAAVMGTLSAIIVGPCVTPPLFAGITFISQTGNVLLGGVTLFAFGLGLGAPLLVIGASMGKLLPRAGAWMKSIQQVFGVVLLAVAIWFIERIVPGPVALMLWALLLIVSAIYMGALNSIQPDASWQKLWKGFGLAILVYGVILIIGAANGGDNLFRPLQGISNSTYADLEVLKFKKIKSGNDLDRELAITKQTKQVAMLDFYADWCVDCKKMERKTFRNKEVHTALKDIVLLKADVTKNDELDKALLSRFNLPGPPAILFFGHDGLEHKAYRLIGFTNAEKFTQHVNQVTAL
jgi:thiol:disulfide interchange protein DsbD